MKVNGPLENLHTATSTAVYFHLAGFHDPFYRRYRLYISKIILAVQIGPSLQIVMTVFIKKTTQIVQIEL